MNTKNVLPRIILTALLLFVPGARAQVVADGATNTLSNVTTNFTGDVTVGTNGSFTLLVLSDNALLTNSVNGVIGRNAMAKSNEVQLLSASARWRMGGSLYVGSNGAFNRLVVSNGALVENSDGSLARTAASSNNFALITGGGSVWSNRNQLDIGGSGPDNRMIVSNGGWVASGTGVLGRDTRSSNNVVLVTGTDSVWTNALDLFVGNLLPGNRLVIEAGGLVSCDEGRVGVGASADNNEVLVTGPGSLWNNRSFTTFIGLSGNFNRLVVSNGAAVRSPAGSVGGSSSVGNQVVVTGAGSTWSNLALTLGTGLFSTGNRVDVSDGGGILTGKGTVGDLGFNNTVFLRDSGSVWNGQGDLIIGNSGSGNMLTVSNGATVLSSNATIGASTSSGQNNLAWLTGAGTLWSNRNDLTLGEFGTGNRLAVSNGATVFIGGNGVIGKNSGASSNVVYVTDTGTGLILASNLYVGSNGAFNLLVVSNAALVANFGGFLGFGVSSSSNVALITGAGSVWSNRQALIIGESGNGNRLEVRDGARVASLVATLGDFDSASNNVVVVSDPGSFWSTEEDGDMTVGLRGGGNRLVITNGAWVRGGGVIGMNPSSTNNEVVVTGAGSSWTNLNGLVVGSVGSRNRLVITNGGEVFSDRGVFLGLTPPATNNRIVVDGGALRSLDPVEGILDVRRGTNVLNAGLIDVNRLLLTNALGKFEFNGGTLITRGAVISNGSTFTVGGPGGVPATWDVRAGAGGSHYLGVALVVGDAASFAQLIHTNGALLTNDSAPILGREATSRSNSVTLAGPASRLWLGDGVIVGDAGSDNRLVVRDGASLVTASISYLGQEIPSSNNEAVVTGPGTFWNSNPEYGLSVGYQGRNNLLRVNDGAQIASGPSVIGEFPTGSNNLAVVTDAGSLWNIQGELRVGQGAAANRLVVSNGASVFATDAVYVGFDPTSTGNRLTVDGGTLRTTNASATGTLDVRRGTNVLNAGLIDVDQLVLTNTLGLFEFNGGKFSTGKSSVNNGQLFRVGNGVSPATFALTGNGAHLFANGLTVSAGALLTGNGTLGGALTVQTGGKLVPGASIGKIVLSNSPSLQGAVVMQISKNGATLTNDQILVTGTLTYGGSLIVTNLGPTALAAGDNFKLFSAGTFAGSFTPLSLPPLNAGLGWTNKLVLDGSIEVVGAAQPKFASITVSGTNVIISGTGGPANALYAVLTATNVALPLSSWVSIVTNQFDAGGGFSFTNGIAPGERQRYFRIRTP